MYPLATWRATVPASLSNATGWVASRVPRVQVAATIRITDQRPSLVIFLYFLYPRTATYRDPP
jgi:hypothetical protein